MGLIEYQEVSFNELYDVDGWTDWVTEYINETANPAIGAAEAQVSRYAALDKDGQLRCVAVLDDGRLVGAAVLLVTQSQHYPFPLVGVDAFYLRKAWRRGRTGLDLLGCAKAVAAKEGAPGFTFMAPPGSAFDKLCDRLGMTHTHNCYWCKCDE